jgi:hypothetical protein
LKFVLLEIILIGRVLYFIFLDSTLSIFTFLFKEQIIDWTIFSSAVLSRFDLYFERNYKNADKISGREFLQNCQKNIKQTNKNSSLEKNRKGWILKIGNRKSNHYFRIYETKNSLKFEHEMKGKVLQNYHLLLVENRLEEFEQKLSSHFLISFGKLLPLHYSYLDWLVLKLRPIRKQTIYSIWVEFRLHQIRNINGYKKFCHASSIFNLCSTSRF